MSEKETKIIINKESLNNSEDNNLFSYLEDKINQIKNEIKSTKGKSCFLVSGYRGSGKSTFVNLLEDRLEKEHNEAKNKLSRIDKIKLLFSKDKTEEIVFIKLNIVKKQAYSLLLRNLIREMYLSIKNNSDINKKLKRNNKDLYKKLDLLYERTFYDITHSKTNRSESKRQISGEGNINLDKVSKAIWIIIILSCIWGYGVIKFINLNENIEILIKIVVWISGVVVIKNITGKFTYDSISSEELSRKSLYDDEIAEYHVKNLFKELSKEGIKIVFVIDELDKIETIEELEATLKELKSILLSEDAIFILIAGQKLYYKMKESALVDDSVISSIFSKNIHIPISTKQELIDFIIDMDEENKDNEIIENYLDSVILESDMIIRKFINKIKQDTTWDNEGPYIQIEENKEFYKTESKILDILTRLMEEIEAQDTDNVLMDFLKVQLFIWIRKMKLRKSESFTKDDIYYFSRDYRESYPEECKVKLDGLINQLFEDLTEVHVLKKNEDKYSWDNINYVMALHHGDNYLTKFIKTMKNIKTIEDGVGEIKAKEIVTFDKEEEDKLNHFRKIFNKINSGKTLVKDEKYLIESSSINLTRYWDDIFKSYVKFTIDKVTNSEIYEFISVKDEINSKTENMGNYFDGVLIPKNRSYYKPIFIEIAPYFTINSRREFVVQEYCRVLNANFDNRIFIITLDYDKNKFNKRYGNRLQRYVQERFTSIERIDFITLTDDTILNLDKMLEEYMYKERNEVAVTEIVDSCRT